MTQRARTLSATVLCVVLFGALAMIVLSLRDPQPPPEPIDISLDFDPFVPGVTQVRSSVLTVPVSSRVREAGVLQSSGVANEVVWTFELCQRTTCRLLVPEDPVEVGAYRVQVSALLPADSVAGVDGRLDGRVVGRVQLAEQSTAAGGVDRTALVWWSAIGLIGVVLAGTVARRVRVVTS